MKQKFKLVYASKRHTVPFRLDNTELDFNDLTFVHDGQLNYIINHEAFTVTKGQAMYCPYGAHRYRYKGTEKAVYTSLNFRCSPTPSVDLPFHILTADSDEIRFYLKNIVELYEHAGTFDKEKSDAFASLVIYTLLDYTTVTEKNKYIADIKNYIAHNWNKKITLDDIAESVHLSTSYSAALFKEHTGSSIIDYCIELRLKNACDMLKYSDRMISEIAEKTGFCDVFYFSRVFKKHMGVSPAAYRNHDMKLS